MNHILAGDVGGTKTVLSLYQIEHGTSGNVSLTAIHKATFASADYPEFEQLITTFMADAPAIQPAAACLGIAGPIANQRCNATNLPWLIDAQVLSSQFGIADVYLINDLEAAAYGMVHLSANEFIELNPQAVPQSGHAAVIAAGTGLGQAIMAWDGQRHIVLPSEGGHCDFAPNTAEEDALLVFLRARFSGHVSGERILAGAGFGNLYDFLCDSGYATPNPVIEAEMMQTDRNAVISSHGLTNDDPLCAEALRLFVRIYGSEAGNLALKCLPRGGLYIGGGIAPKIRQALESGVFMQGFLDKGRMSHAIQHIPVRLSLNPEAPLLGAAHMAAFRLQQA